MWVAEFKVWHKGSPLLPISEKLDVHMFSQYLNSFEENGVPKIMRLAVFWGKDKERAIQELYSHPRAEIVYRERDRVFFTQEAIRSFHTTVSDKHIFFLGPIVEEKGFQWWKVGSNKKENLLNFFKKIRKMKKYAKIELLGIRDQKISGIPFSRISDFPEKDLVWWKTCLAEGYYEYPRRISLQKLARKLGVPYSTLKDHLRKTEILLMKKIGREL